MAGAEQEFGQEVQPGLQIVLESQRCIFLLQKKMFSKRFQSPKYFPEPVKALANYLLFSLFIFLQQLQVCDLTDVPEVVGLSRLGPSQRLQDVTDSSVN